jgi:hypothetical protein
MNQQPTIRRIALPLLILALALLVPVTATAQDQPPTIPHPIEGREACLL